MKPWPFFICNTKNIYIIPACVLYSMYVFLNIKNTTHASVAKVITKRPHTGFADDKNGICNGDGFTSRY